MGYREAGDGNGAIRRGRISLKRRTVQLREAGHYSPRAEDGKIITEQNSPVADTQKRGLSGRRPHGEFPGSRVVGGVWQGGSGVFSCS